SRGPVQIDSVSRSSYAIVISVTGRSSITCVYRTVDGQGRRVVGLPSETQRSVLDRTSRVNDGASVAIRQQGCRGTWPRGFYDPRVTRWIGVHLENAKSGGAGISLHIDRRRRLR